MAVDEIIVGRPMTVYVGPVGEAYPDVDEAPAGNWVLLGTNGAEDFGEEGLNVAFSDTQNDVMVYGATAPVKSVRSAEGIVYSFTLVDMKPEQFARAMNFNTVANTAAGAGTPGYDQLNLYKGFTVAERAWIFRGENASPEGTTWNKQFELPRGVVRGNPTISYNKTGPASYTIEVMALYDTTETAGEEMGRLITQDATAI